MLSKKAKIVILILMFFTIFMKYTKVEAVTVSQPEYTEEYREWLELPEDKREQYIAPKMFDLNIEYSKNNILTKLKNLMNSLGNSDFDLRDSIMKNLAIRNQGNTNACWAFATLSSLETNLALRDNSKIYDYSESHMDYSTSQSFNDRKLENGFTREVVAGGNFQMGSAYLTNGSGAVLEKDMPFIDTKEDISIKTIEGKEVVTKVLDTEEFGTFTNSIPRDELILKMKEHIRENGSISAGIHGANLSEACYNNATGAIYCGDKNKCKMDHNVSIVGWYDGYEVDNFNTQPNEKGAWIIRNSWGDKVGDNGFMYVSYEDVNIYDQLFGIEKATENVDYDNIYQYNELGYNNALVLGNKQIYVANVFERNKQEGEELTEVALNVMQKVKCKVYVNPNNESKDLKDLIEVELKEGKTETFDAGYHTLEFKNPIKLTGDKFVVIIEIEALQDSSVYCNTLTKTTNNFWDNVKVKENVSYITYGEFFEKNQWIDTVVNAANINSEPSNLTVKAFTREVGVIVTPIPTPTVAPTQRPAATPTQEPTVEPTPIQRPTATPTQEPTVEPTPTQRPTATPTQEPTVEPTPTQRPTATPTQEPTVEPTPTQRPTATPTQKPTQTVNPTVKPSNTNSNNSDILGSINTNSSSSGSTVTNQSSLPYVGKTEIVLGLIILLSINMVIVYKKYKKIY